MPEHYVEVKLPAVEILNKNLEVLAYADNKLIGAVTMSRGGIDYRPTGYTYSVSLSWEAFDALMREQQAL